MFLSFIPTFVTEEKKAPPSLYDVVTRDKVTL
jgi:hypothetical protein